MSRVNLLEIAMKWNRAEGRKHPVSFQVSHSQICDYCDKNIEYAGCVVGFTPQRVCANHLKKAVKTLEQQKKYYEVEL